MRYVLAILAATVAMSIPAAESPADPFLMGAALTEEVRQRCGAGCVIFNRAEAVELERAIGQMIANAHRIGQREGSSHCRL